MGAKDMPRQKIRHKWQLLIGLEEKNVKNHGVNVSCIWFPCCFFIRSNRYRP